VLRSWAATPASIVISVLAGTCAGRTADLLGPTPSAPVTDQRPARRLDSIFVFAGTLTDGNMGQSVNAFKVPCEDKHIAGVAHDHDFFVYSSVVVSGKVGVADRFGSGSSGELWGGAHLRINVPISHWLYLIPGITGGLSAVTNCVGIECQREMQHQGNAHLLFYFSPEVAFALPQFPNVDLVYQLHHRSGLFGTLGRMEEGTNANVLGIRYHL
jgi:hypothetical protein